MGAVMGPEGCAPNCTSLEQTPPQQVHCPAAVLSAPWEGLRRQPAQPSQEGGGEPAESRAWGGLGDALLEVRSETEAPHGFSVSAANNFLC